MPKQTFICQYCGKQFEAWACNKPKFCGPTCHYTAHSGAHSPKWTQVSVICEYCGKHFTKQNSQFLQTNHHYCSRICANKANVPHQSQTKQTGRDIQCAWCGRWFYRARNSIRKINFCCRECVHAYTLRKRVTIICEHCGKKRRVAPSTFNKGARFCSYKCFLASSGCTSLEKLGYQLLEIMALDFELQYRLGNFVVDAYIPIFNLVVQFDGDYWHSLPGRRETDVRHNAEMNAQGIQVVRVGEKELHDNYNILRYKIIDTCHLAPDSLPLIPDNFSPDLTTNTYPNRYNKPTRISIPRTCLQCGKIFHSYNPNPKYCSKECHNISMRKH